MICKKFEDFYTSSPVTSFSARMSLRQYELIYVALYSATCQQVVNNFKEYASHKTHRFHLFKIPCGARLENKDGSV